MHLALALSLAAVRRSGIRPPAGYRFVTDDDGRYLIDDDGRRIVVEI